MYRLSKLIPVRMRSTYGVELGDDQWTETATWWQWRGRIFRHRTTHPAAA
jgi:hypothetical protein